MKLSIINTDKSVYKDGVYYTNLNLSTIPSNVHALQWNSENNTGWIEFVDNPDGTKSAHNETITELPSWGQDALDAWDAAAVAEKIVTEEQISMFAQMFRDLQASQANG